MVVGSRLQGTQLESDVMCTKPGYNAAIYIIYHVSISYLVQCKVSQWIIIHVGYSIL